jgi:hypothetical protein
MITFVLPKFKFKVNALFIVTLYGNVQLYKSFFLFLDFNFT